MTIDDLLDYDVDLLVERFQFPGLGFFSVYKFSLVYTLPSTCWARKRTSSISIFIQTLIQTHEQIVYFNDCLAFVHRISNLQGKVTAFTRPLPYEEPISPALDKRRADSISKFTYKGLRRWMNRLFKGLMFKIGVFMGWADVASGPIPWATLVPVYVRACLWTITYETVYQHQV